MNEFLTFLVLVLYTPWYCRTLNTASQHFESAEKLLAENKSRLPYACCGATAACLASTTPNHHNLDQTFLS